VALMLHSKWSNMNGPARGPGSAGASRRTVMRALASSRFYVTVARLADHHRQRGGGWFTHGSVRALTDQARLEIGLTVSVADAREWAARKGLTVPLDKLPSRGYDLEFGAQVALRNPVVHRLSAMEFGTRTEENPNAEEQV